MSTNIRNKLSKRNEYYLSKDRILELKHFCLQYPTWKKARAHIYDLSAAVISDISNRPLADSTARKAESLERFDRLMQVIELSAKETDEYLSSYILKGVTEGRTYNTLRTMYNIPVCRETYYKLYRKFFYILNSKRDV